MKIELHTEDVSRLYGTHIYIIPAPGSRKTAPAGKIQWRPKPASKVLFVLHQAEMRNAELTDLLRKIVESIGIPFDAAGFGVITGRPNLGDLEAMPNPHAVIFDHKMNPGKENPLEISAGRIVFAHTLQELSESKEHKQTLWEHLKTIRSLID